MDKIFMGLFETIVINSRWMGFKQCGNRVSEKQNNSIHPLFRTKYTYYKF